MVGHETFFDGSIVPANGIRLALPRPDYRWRFIALQNGALEPEDFLEEEVPVEQEIEAFSTDPWPSSPEALEPPQILEAATPLAAELPHIKFMKMAQMYDEAWRPVKIATSEEKSYAVLLPRDSKWTMEQAIKRRQAIIITMDENGKITVQDLRALPPNKRPPWWQRLFKWR